VVNAGSPGWTDRSAFVTGHTGFKGSWLAIWLHQLGASVHGFALDPPTTPSLYEIAGVESLMSSDVRADLGDFGALGSALERARPEVIFHLAAQPLVRESYRDPLNTFATNVMGTAHLLEAARTTESVRAVVLVTTDKVYVNNEGNIPHRESDPLGGLDPYSGSKAAAEIVAASYRASFFMTEHSDLAHVATARAGNVIGGGDWGHERLVPDCLRAFEEGRPVRLRYPQAVRPWQHVLDPLSGYLRLATRLRDADGGQFAAPWNFGPDVEGEASVEQVAGMAAEIWGPGASVEAATRGEHPYETETLRLDARRAHAMLNWAPHWTLRETLERTVSWHRAWMGGADMLDVTRSQIHEYAQRDVT
jgi:CDP-glucose 4,6-dehydratase